MSPLYTVVIPCKNEQETIESLLTEVQDTMDALGSAYEVLVINDGSTDQTLMKILERKKTFPQLQVLDFDQNYGQSAGFAAGFAMAQAPFILTMDGDGQNCPSDIPRLLAFQDDYDLVCGIRQTREDNYLKRFISYLANTVRCWLLEDPVIDTGCSLKLYRTSCVRKIKMLDGMHRFLPALFQIEGFRVHSVAVSHKSRKGGMSHYSLWNRSIKPFFDLFGVLWIKKRRLRYHIRKHL